MSNNSRVLNISRRFMLKHKQAVRGVENCSFAWVDFGVSVRDLTLAEAQAARIAKKKMAEPLPYAEMRGIVFRRPGHESEIYAEHLLATEANQVAVIAQQA